MLTTMIFYTAEFHHQNYKSGKSTTDEAVNRVLTQIEERITKGLSLDRHKVSALNYEALEQRASLAGESTENNLILRGVAEAVAEAGPWNASMEMVAKHSGLSKSGLYAHFKNKQDMLRQFLLTEFNRIANFARSQIETTEVHEEQLYLAIASIVHYLRARPEIFAAIDWIKARELNLGKTMPGRLYRIIRSIKMEAIREQDPHFLFWAAQWILFMIVNTLALWPSKPAGNCALKGKAWAQSAAEVPNESFRALFRFIALGLEGLDL
jgi:AcrR family transcriptional regulator